MSGSHNVGEVQSAGLRIHCDRCHQPLQQQGALVFGPPNMVPTVLKMHVCLLCWPAVRAFMEQGPHFPPDEHLEARP